ncbi:MAG: ribose 5-phosphate isomerase B [Actinobacteria bacterium]|nr:ribose 5-phosphate isomerase B [Actinomycetota bacterium]MBU1492535.1 ribose 5-phosphate isomerase B [Actinomycetota bacterium]
MRVAIGADHAGYALKELLAARMAASGHSVIDLGTHSEAPVDYPDYAEAVARAVVDGKADRGLVVCGSGAGASIAANKVKGARCAVTHDTYSAHQVVEHDDANIVAVGSRVIGSDLAGEIVDAFLGARFSGEERHVRRLGKVKALEDRFGPRSA